MTLHRSFQVLKPGSGRGLRPSSATLTSAVASTRGRNVGRIALCSFSPDKIQTTPEEDNGDFRADQY